MWWAGFGAAMVALQIYVYGSWITGDNFRAVSTGADPVPEYQKTWAIVLQIAYTATAVMVTGWVLRGCLRQRRMTFDAKLLLGWWSILWLDPVQFFLRPVNLYNSYYFNRGSWVPYIPGWISPNMQNFPNPWFLEGAAYGFMLISSIAACALLRAVRHRWPRTPNAVLFMVAWVALGIGIFLLEEYLMIRPGWLSWSGVPHEVAIFAGTEYQFPWTEAFFYGATCAAMASLRFWRDDRGRSVVERGIESVPARRQAVVATLAVIGFANVAMIAYNLCMIGQSLYVDPFPDTYKSYMLNGICGQGTEYRCPAPDVPIVLNAGK
jgi:hypothetical protein